MKLPQLMEGRDLLQNLLEKSWHNKLKYKRGKKVHYLGAKVSSFENGTPSAGLVPSQGTWETSSVGVHTRGK